jgi:hypothetical protein
MIYRKRRAASEWTLVWNNIRYDHVQKIGKPTNFTVFGNQYIHEYDSLVNYLGKGLKLILYHFTIYAYNRYIFNVDFYFYFFSLQN